MKPLSIDAPRYLVDPSRLGLCAFPSRPRLIIFTAWFDALWSGSLFTDDQQVAIFLVVIVLGALVYGFFTNKP